MDNLNKSMWGWSNKVNLQTDVETLRARKSQLQPDLSIWYLNETACDHRLFSQDPALSDQLPETLWQDVRDGETGREASVHLPVTVCQCVVTVY